MSILPIDAVLFYRTEPVKTPLKDSLNNKVPSWFFSCEKTIHRLETYKKKKAEEFMQQQMDLIAFIETFIKHTWESISVPTLLPVFPKLFPPFLTLHFQIISEFLIGLINELVLIVGPWGNIVFGLL